MKVLFAILFMLSFAPNAHAGNEKEHQIALCAGMEIELFIKRFGTHVDCVSDTHAIEVDFSVKWAEAIGQSLHYALELKKRPGIILICKRTTTDKICVKHSYMVEEVLANWHIAATMWLCRHETVDLSQCSRIEVD